MQSAWRRRGSTTSPQSSREPPPRRIGVTDEAYGLSEFADAERFGYLGEDWNARIAEFQQGRSVRDELSPAYLEALTGAADPLAAGGQPGGCLGKVAAARNGEAALPDDARRAIDEIAATAVARTRSDPAVLDGFAAWSDCMAEAGYDFDAPSEPPQAVPPVVIDANDLRPVPERSAAEIAMALADQRCKRQVGLFETWVTTEGRYQREGIAQHEAVLAEYKAAVDARVAAREVLERSGGADPRRAQPEARTAGAESGKQLARCACWRSL